MNNERTFTVGGIVHKAAIINLNESPKDVAGLIQKYSLNPLAAVNVDVTELTLCDNQRKLRDYSINEFCNTFKIRGYTRTHSIIVVERNNAVSGDIVVVDGNQRVAAIKRILADDSVKPEVKDELRHIPAFVLAKETPMADLMQIGISK